MCLCVCVCVCVCMCVCVCVCVHACNDVCSEQLRERNGVLDTNHSSLKVFHNNKLDV